MPSLHFTRYEDDTGCYPSWSSPLRCCANKTICHGWFIEHRAMGGRRGGGGGLTVTNVSRTSNYSVIIQQHARPRLSGYGKKKSSCKLYYILKPGAFCVRRCILFRSSTNLHATIMRTAGLATKPCQRADVEQEKSGAALRLAEIKFRILYEPGGSIRQA